MGSINKQQIDELDKRLIVIIQENPGIRLFELTELVNGHPMTIRTRVINLRREGYLKTEKGKRSLKIFPLGEVKQ